MRLRSALVVLALLAAVPASGQPVEVTFRFVPDLTGVEVEPVVRAFVPGSFNDWGQPYKPGTPSCIQEGDESQMTYDAALAEYRLATTLDVGATYPYKVQYQQTEAGTTCTWIADPLNDGPTDGDGNSLVEVEDLFVFQIAREQDGTDVVRAVSAGVFGTADITSVQFTVNGTAYPEADVVDTGDGVYRLELAQPVAPGSFVEVTATDAEGRTVTESVGTIPPTVTDRPVPDGLEDGINYTSDDTAVLVLRAPGKGYVYALGSFNGWTASEDALLFRDDTDPLGTRWWIELTGLTPGVEQTFYYWVDGLTRVADPYTTKVYYPGEAGYPAGAQDHAVGVLTPGAEPFPWTDGDFEPPAQEDLVIYELLLRDFLRDHSFTTLADTLDYLERLGVNAVELMPVSEFDGDQSWGYNPAFHLALDKYYGTPDELKAFVDAAHARGMAVILDVVYNHATGQSPLVRLYNQGDFGPPTAENPWANVEATHPFNVFNDLDHTSPLTQLWLDKANRFWADEYHVDGYRFDLTGGFYQTGSYFEYNPERIAVLERMMGALWETNPDTYVILEHLVENGPEWRELAAYRAGDDARPGPLLWHHMNREYNESSMGYTGPGGLFSSELTQTWTPQWAGGIPVPNAVTYMESHDEQWMMYRNLAFGNTGSAGSGYNVRELPTALERQKLAGAFFLTVPGPRMLWQFGELGYGGGPGECLVNGDYPGECPQGVPGRVDPKPIRWDYWAEGAAPFANGFQGSLEEADDAERERRQRLYRTWAALLDLRQSYEIFRSPDTDVETRLGLVPDRWIRLSLDGAPDGQPAEAVVFGNFGVTETTVSLSFDEPTTWYDYFDDTETTVPAGTYTATLAPGEFSVWTDVDVPSPDGDLLGPVAGEPGPVGDRFPEGLLSVFPNPTADGAALRFVLYEPRDVRVEMYDVLGRRVRTLADGRYPEGTHDVAFRTDGLPAGVYVVHDGARSLRLTVAR